MPTKKRKTKPRRVDMNLHEDDVQAAVDGMLGMAVSLSVSDTGLTKGQVSYRRKWADVKVSDYRNGKSWIAKKIRQNAMDIVGPPAVERLVRMSPSYKKPRKNKK